MTPTTKQYYAFISYKRDDQKWAEWLQEKLEHYKLPTNLNGRSDLPKEIRPVFRDKSELAAGVLADEIQKALDNSKYLIVICSPHSAKSEWVNKEVQAFIESGRTDKIIPFIIDGTPNSGKDETECFPKAIRELPAEDELLGVNINEMGRDAAAVKVVAQMFGLRFDDLWQRHEREKKRKRHLITAGITAFAIAVICVAGLIWHQNVVLKQQRWQMLENQSKLVSEMIKSKIEDNPFIAKQIALEILPKDVTHPTDRPYTVEAEYVLRTASKYKPVIVKEFPGDIREIKYSPNGKIINVRIFSSTSAYLKVLDTETGYEIKTCNCSDIYNDINVDGKSAVANKNGVMVVYDYETGEEKRVFDQYDDVAMLAYIDEFSLLTLHSNSMERIWHTKKEEIIMSFDISDEIIPCISPDGKQMAYYQINDDTNSMCDNKEVVLIIEDIETGNKNSTCLWADLEEYNIYKVAFSYDGNRLITFLQNGDIMVWDIETGRKVSCMRNHSGVGGWTISFSPDGRQIVSGHEDGYIRLWDVTTGDLIQEWIGHSGYVGCIVFSPDGKSVASTSDGGVLKIWDLESMGSSHVLKETGCRIDNSSFVNAGKVYYNIKNNTADVFDISKETDKQISLNTSAYFYVSKDNNRCFYFDESKIWICDLETGDTLRTFKMDYKIQQIQLSKDEKRAFVISWYDNKEVSKVSKETLVDVWDVENGERIKQLHVDFNEGQRARISDINKNGTKMALLEANYVEDEFINGYKIIIVDVETGLTTNRLGAVYAKFSPDDKYLAASYYNENIKIYDVNTGENKHELKGMIEPLSRSIFSSDGKYIISSLSQTEYAVWDVETGGLVYKLGNGNDTIAEVCFDENIITVSTNGAIRQYDFPPLQDLIDQTRERFKNRPLTEEERKMHYLE